MKTSEWITTPKGRLRMIAFIEGLSYLVILGVTMPMKYWMDIPEPNRFVGMLHGVFFVLYILAVLQSSILSQWSKMKLIMSLFVSVIPFGTFWADYKWFSKELH